MSNSLNNVNKKDVCAIEIVYMGGKRRFFNLSNPVFRYDALDLQVRLESFKDVFRVNCHTTLNKYF